MTSPPVFILGTLRPICSRIYRRNAYSDDRQKSFHQDDIKRGTSPSAALTTSRRHLPAECTQDLARRCACFAIRLEYGDLAFSYWKNTSPVTLAIYYVRSLYHRKPGSR